MLLQPGATPNPRVVVGLLADGPRLIGAAGRSELPGPRGSDQLAVQGVGLQNFAEIHDPAMRHEGERGPEGGG